MKTRQQRHFSDPLQQLSRTCGFLLGAYDPPYEPRPGIVKPPVQIDGTVRSKPCERGNPP